MKILLFDIDGTLIRTGGAGIRAMSRSFKEVMGWEQALAKISPAGLSDRLIANLISQKIQGQDMSAVDQAEVFKVYFKHLRTELKNNIEQYKILPGIKKFLDFFSLQQGYLIGLGTGNLEEGARIKLEFGKLNRYFKFGGFGSDSQKRPEILNMAVKRAQDLLGTTISPDQVVIIGDTQHDIQAAKAIGARSIAVATGPLKVSQLFTFSPDVVVEDFTQFQVINNFFKSF